MAGSSSESNTRARVRALMVVAAVVGLLAAVLMPVVSAQENEPPTAVVFSPTGTTVNSGDEITLDGSLSFDPEGSELSYRWTPEPAFSWLPLSGGGTEPTVTFFVPDDRYIRDRGGAQSFNMTLTVTDEQGLSSSRRLRLTLNPGPMFQDITGPPDEQLEVTVGDSGTEIFPLSLRRDAAGVRTAPTGVGGGRLYVVDEGDRVRLRVQAVGNDVTYRWEQVFGEGTPVQLSGDSGPSVTFTAPRVTKTDAFGSVEGQTEDLVVMVTATDADGGSNFLRFSLRVREVDESTVADAGPDQEAALPLNVMPEQLEDEENVPPEKVRVRLDATGTTDPDPYDVPVAVADDPATAGTDEFRTPTVSYRWSVVELETADGLSSADEDDDNAEDNAVRQQLRALRGNLRFELPEPDDPSAVAAPVGVPDPFALALDYAQRVEPPSDLAAVDPTEADCGDMAHMNYDHLACRVFRVLDGLESDLMANSRSDLNAALMALGPDRSAMDLTVSYRMYQADRLYEPCREGTQGCDEGSHWGRGGLGPIDPETSEPTVRDFAGYYVERNPMDSDPGGVDKVELNFYEAAIEVIEQQRRRQIIYGPYGPRDRGYDLDFVCPTISEDGRVRGRIRPEIRTQDFVVPTSAEVNDWLEQRIKEIDDAPFVLALDPAITELVVPVPAGRTVGELEGGGGGSFLEYILFYDPDPAVRSSAFARLQRLVDSGLSELYQEVVRRQSADVPWLRLDEGCHLPMIDDHIRSLTNFLHPPGTTEFPDTSDYQGSGSVTTTPEEGLILVTRSPQTTTFPAHYVWDDPTPPTRPISLNDEISCTERPIGGRNAPDPIIIRTCGPAPATLTYDNPVQLTNLYPLVLPRNPNTYIEVVDATAPTGPVVFLVMPAACDVDGDGECAEGEDAEEHPLLGGRVVVEVTTQSSGGGPASTDRVEVLVSEDSNVAPVAEASVRNNVGRLVSELQVLEGEPVVLSGVQSGDGNDNAPDFDGLTYIWTQTRPTPVDANGDELPENPTSQQRAAFVCVNCVFGSDSAGSLTTFEAESQVVFSGDVTGLQPTPQGRRPRQTRFEFALQVRDQYGVSAAAAERVRVVVVEANEPPTVDAGDDVEVASGESVTLMAVVTDPDLVPEDSDESHTYAWSQTAGEPVDLDDARSESVSFTADAGTEGATLEFSVTVTDSRGLSAADTVTVTIGEGTAEEGDDGDGEGPGVDFYSGVITGPEFCTNMSLGGPRTYAFDSDGDGVADVCSLRTTREVAIERQNALEAQAADNRDRFLELVLAACAEVPAWVLGDPGDVCASEVLGVAPAPPSAEEAPMLYSGIITGPEFCTNMSLGGPRTYAFDSDRDGVADICSLPWSRREAVARQNALEALSTELNT